MRRILCMLMSTVLLVGCSSGDGEEKTTGGGGGDSSGTTGSSTDGDGGDSGNGGDDDGDDAEDTPSPFDGMYDVTYTTTQDPGEESESISEDRYLVILDCDKSGQTCSYERIGPDWQESVGLERDGDMFSLETDLESDAADSSSGCMSYTGMFEIAIQVTDEGDMKGSSSVSYEVDDPECSDRPIPMSSTIEGPRLASNTEFPPSEDAGSFEVELTLTEVTDGHYPDLVVGDKASGTLDLTCVGPPDTDLECYFSSSLSDPELFFPYPDRSWLIHEGSEYRSASEREDEYCPGFITTSEVVIALDGDKVSGTFSRSSPVDFPCGDGSTNSGESLVVSFEGTRAG